MIVIIDYRIGNVGSVFNMLKKIGAEAIISSDQDMISQADKLILPGVGSFDKAMQNLSNLDLIELLHYKVLVKKNPILGICLGMQLFTQSSEEGTLPGFGWFNAKTVRFKNLSSEFKIPHMGWNFIKPQKACPLFEGMNGELRYYFVHSYYVKCCHKDDILAETEHGIVFTSAVQRDNIFATQFHPEKSHKYGLNLLKNFANISHTN